MQAYWEIQSKVLNSPQAICIEFDFDGHAKVISTPIVLDSLQPCSYYRSRGANSRPRQWAKVNVALHEPIGMTCASARASRPLQRALRFVSSANSRHSPYYMNYLIFLFKEKALEYLNNMQSRDLVLSGRDSNEMFLLKQLSI